MLTHEELIENYRIDNQANTQSLLEYKEARRYYHGSQLPEDILEKLNLRGQPPIVENIYKMIVNKILGYKIQSLQEIKVSGRQEEDKPLANILNDLLKVFSQQQNYDKQIIARDRELIFGMAVLETWVEIDSEGDKHVELKSIAPDCFLVDAYSKDSNALDSRRFHRRIDLDKEQATALFGENVYVENHTLHDSRTTVIESWYCEERASTWREQKWARYFWHEQGGIYQYEQSPCATGGHPFIIAKYQIDERNRWYGLFRDIKPLQDFINFAENRAVNMLGSFKALFEDDAVLDTEEFIDSVGLDNAVIKVRSGALKENKIQFIKHNAEIQALSQKTEHKRHLAKILSGLNDEALGMAVNRQSGVAIAQRRDAGLLGLQDFIKAGDDMDRLLFEKVLSLMIAYFSNEQVFKIVDSKNKERYFSINTNEDNKLRAGKFDLIFKTTLKQEGREERFTHWAEIFKIIGSTRGDLAPALLPLVLKDVDSPIVAELQDLLEQKDEEARAAQEAQAPLQETQQQLALAEAQAKIAELEAKANKYNAQAKTQESITENLAAEQAQQANQTPQGATPSPLPQTPTKSTGSQESPAQKQAFKAMQINPKKAIYDQR